jgi:hypothetical protein
MKSWDLWGLRLGSIFCLVACAGCFLEVGNPGEKSQISAQFQIDYGTGALAKSGVNTTISGVYVTTLQVGFLEMDYLTSGDSSEHSLWNNDSSTGVTVDFARSAGPDSLPTVSIPVQTFTKVIAEFTTPASPSTFGPNPKYLKGYVKTADSIPFLFPIPALDQFNLIYGSTILNSWRRSGSYDIEILFSVPRWLDSVDLSQAQSTLDSSGQPILLLDSLHNAPVYLKLKSNFLKAFNSDSTYVGVD